MKHPVESDVGMLSMFGPNRSPTKSLTVWKMSDNSTTFLGLRRPLYHVVIVAAFERNKKPVSQFSNQVIANGKTAYSCNAKLIVGLGIFTIITLMLGDLYYSLNIFTKLNAIGFELSPVYIYAKSLAVTPRQ